VDGGGCTKAPNLALELKKVGYDVAVLADSDEVLNPTEAELVAAGIRVFVWDGTMATEQRITADIPTVELQAFLDKAIEAFEEEPVYCHIRQYGKIDVSKRDRNIAGWFALDGETTVRSALGIAAKKGGKGWFKNITMGVWLGEMVGPTLVAIPVSPLAKKLRELTDWIYG
jgi:hypothetical protein